MNKIAIIDDEALVRESFAAILGTRDLETTCFASGEEFFANCDLSSVDCLLVDLRLPGMSGVDIIRRTNREGFRIPALLISGNLDDDLLQGLDVASPVTTLRKPCRAAVVISRVRELVGGLTDNDIGPIPSVES